MHILFFDMPLPILPLKSLSTYTVHFFFHRVAIKGFICQSDEWKYSSSWLNFLVLYQVFNVTWLPPWIANFYYTLQSDLHQARSGRYDLILCQHTRAAGALFVGQPPSPVKENSDSNYWHFLLFLKQKAIQLALEQHRFERPRYTYIWIWGVFF